MPSLQSLIIQQASPAIMWSAVAATFMSAASFMSGGSFLKNVSLVALPFSLYLAWTKIGHRVYAQVRWGAGGFVASGVVSVTLINMKDRTIPIYKIILVLDDMILDLMTFETPLILKAYEATTQKPEQVSEYIIDGNALDNLMPKSLGSNQIYLVSNRIIKCRSGGRPLTAELKLHRQKRNISTAVWTVNGNVYNRRAKYALAYVEDGKLVTTFIGKAGDIGWKRAPNMLRPADLVNAAKAKDALRRDPRIELIEPIEVFDLDHH